MQHQTKPIQDLLLGLPIEIRDQVEDFIDFMMERRARRPIRKLRLDWRGALRDFGTQYTSVELQHSSLDWWGN